MPRNKWQWKHDDPNSMGFSTSSSKKEVSSNTSLPQEMKKKHQINNLTTPKPTRKKRTTTTKNPATVSRGKEIIKIRTEVNEKEMMETIAKISKTKNWLFDKIKLTDH